jgi:3-oxoacyl-[acyl-carrier-protein] synthase II
MSDREVVITGTGLLTPLGKNTEENWENLKSMKTGISFSPSGNNVPEQSKEISQQRNLPAFFQYKGKVNHIETPGNISPKLLNQMKFLNRGSHLGFRAAHEAVVRSGIQLFDIPPERRALYIASGDFTNVGYDFMYPALQDGSDTAWQQMNFEKLNRSTMNKVNPFFLLESIHNNLFSFLSAYLEFMGSNTSLASLSPCGGQALELAYQSIQNNKADIALAVGCGSWINEIALYELEGLGMLSRCTSGTRSFRPFDRNRDGFIPGEGGAVILLEASENAHRRGAEILGKILGFGNCIEFSPGSGLSLFPRVSRRGITNVLEDSGCGIHDLSFTILHGSGTQQGDRSELKSISDILGNSKPYLPLCGLKPYTGHMGAASDIAEVIFGITAIGDNMVPATLNFQKAEKEFADLTIANSHAVSDKNVFLSFSYGIGGHSSSVVVEVM